MIRRLLTTTICLILCCGISLKRAEAAISSAIIWEVRTTGNVNNGGGFKAGASGTDYSQQDAAQIAFTDLVIGNPTTTNLTSAGNPFTSAHVGNVIKITGGTGFTTGYYEITSVASNVATIDRSVGTAGSTGGTGNLGGASDHIDTVSAPVVAGNTIYIKNGSYLAVGANAYVLNTAVAGGNGTPITWIGYTGSRADATGANRPIFDANSAVTNALVADQSGNVFKNIIFKNATGNGISNTANETFYNCQVSNNTGDGINNSGGSVRSINSEANNNGGDGMDLGTTGNSTTLVAFTYVHDNTGLGINLGSIPAIINTISESNSSHGFGGTSCALIANSVAYNNTSSNGFYFNINSGTATIFLNNIAFSNGAYGFSRVNTSAAPMSIFDFNLYNGNTSGGLNNVTAGANDVTASPSFTNAASGDFTYSSSSSPAIGAGLPQSFQGATGDYNWNMGVDQGDHVTGGGGSGYSRGRVVNQ